MTVKTHWKKVYSSKAAERLGWYVPHLQTALAMIVRTKIGKEAKIIDAGGGASTFVDDLLSAGFENITVIDSALTGLDQARSRIGKRAATVQWMEGDVTSVDLPANFYDVWHDRAVFHFLKEPERRKQYVRQMRRALKKWWTLSYRYLCTRSAAEMQWLGRDALWSGAIAS